MRKAFIVGTKTSVNMFVSESLEPDSVNITFRNEQDCCLFSVMLNEAEFLELCDLRYKIDFQKESVGPFEPPEAI